MFVVVVVCWQWTCPRVVSCYSRSSRGVATRFPPLSKIKLFCFLLFHFFAPCFLFVFLFLFSDLSERSVLWWDRKQLCKPERPTSGTPKFVHAGFFKVPPPIQNQIGFIYYFNSLHLVCFSIPVLRFARKTSSMWDRKQFCKQERPTSGTPKFAHAGLFKVPTPIQNQVVFFYYFISFDLVWFSIPVFRFARKNSSMVRLQTSTLGNCQSTLGNCQSKAACTSPDGQGGMDYWWAGNGEPFTCKTVMIPKLTGQTAQGVGKTWHEYKCCPPPSKCSPSKCTSPNGKGGRDCWVGSGEVFTCAAGYSSKMTGPSPTLNRSTTRTKTRTTSTLAAKSVYLSIYFYIYIYFSLHVSLYVYSSLSYVLCT